MSQIEHWYQGNFWVGDFEVKPRISRNERNGILNRTSEVTTSQGELLKLKPFKWNRQDYTDKYFTSNCQDCPLFVPPSSLSELLSTLWYKQGLSQIVIPNEIEGICAACLSTRGDTIPKFLVKPSRRTLWSCNISRETVTTRAQDKRIDGGLKINPQREIANLLATIPQHRNKVSALAQQATTEMTDQDQILPFKLLALNNRLHAPEKSLTVILSQKYPLPDFLLHFLTVIQAMGIKQPVLAREWVDIREGAADYEGGFTQANLVPGDLDYDKVRASMETQAKQYEKDYLERDIENIVDYIPPKDFYDYMTLHRTSHIYPGKRFFECERSQSAITLRPTLDSIGDLDTITIAEAYLVYILNHQATPQPQN